MYASCYFEPSAETFVIFNLLLYTYSLQLTYMLQSLIALFQFLSKTVSYFFTAAEYYICLLKIL